MILREDGQENTAVNLFRFSNCSSQMLVWKIYILSPLLGLKLVYRSGPRRWETDQPVASDTSGAPASFATAPSSSTSPASSDYLWYLAISFIILLN